MKTERKALAKNQRREAILDKIQPLVFERGFDSLTIDDFAEAAQYTKRSLYHYFPDRDHIFFALVARGQKILVHVLREAELKAPAGRNGVRMFGATFYEFSTKNPEYFELWMSYESRRHRYQMGRSAVVDDYDGLDICHNLSIDLAEIMIRWLAAEKKAGRLKTRATPIQLMLLFWGQIYGVMQILLMRQHGFEGTYGTAAKKLFDTFVHGLINSYWK